MPSDSCADFDSPTAGLATPAMDHEFNFSARDFTRVRELIYQRAGISLHAGKQAMVYSRLSRRLRETGHQSFADYLQMLESRGDGHEWQEFVNCLTTNLTSFFREEHHFAELAHELAQRRRPGLRLWCNAASTGEEPYSIAMVAAEALGTSHGMTLLATDIDTNVLATAARGVYAADARGLSPERLRAHFLRGKGANSGFIRVKPELARSITFRTHNLIDERWSLGESFDIVFCRNVMIYFDQPTRERLVRRFAELLVPGGYLCIGHSESIHHGTAPFRLVGKTIYRRNAGDTHD